VGRGRLGAPALSYQNRMLLVLGAGWATLQCGRFLLPPLLPRITSVLAFSPAGIGAALTVFGLVYAVVQYPSGTYSDSLSRATLILPGFVVLLASFVAIGAAVTAAIFVVAVVLLGVGKGLFASPSRALLGDLFTARRGRALGIYSAGTDVGGLVAAGLAVGVLATTTWRMAFVPVVAVLAVVTVLYVLWNREPYELDRVEMEVGETAGRLLATQAQRERLVAFAVFYFFVGGLINFFPTLLVRGGFSDTDAGAIFALIFAVGIVTKPVAGDVSDRFPRLVVAIAGLLVAIGGMCLILLAPQLPGPRIAVVAAGTMLAAVGYKTQFPIADAAILEAAPDENMGGDLGAARGVFLTANAVGPGVVGLIAERADFVVAFWVLTATLLVSVGLLTRQYVRES
jgi:MFS family permease